jgi:large subunit ribosomal protein L15
MLGRGEIDQKIEIEVHACSKSAREKVEDAGGSVTIINN